MITFTTPTERPIPTGTETRWPSTDSRWALVEVRSHYGRRRRRERILLVRCLLSGEYLVGRFHCRRAAIRAAREMGPD